MNMIDWCIENEMNRPRQLAQKPKYPSSKYNIYYKKGMHYEWWRKTVLRRELNWDEERARNGKTEVVWLWVWVMEEICIP